MCAYASLNRKKAEDNSARPTRAAPDDNNPLWPSGMDFKGGILFEVFTLGDSTKARQRA